MTSIMHYKNKTVWKISF